MKLAKKFRQSIKKSSIILVKYSGFARAIRIVSNILDEIEKEQLRQYPNIHKSVNFSGRNLVVTSPDKLIMGEGSVFHDDTYLETTGGLTIGKYVHIGRGLTIFTTNHNYQSKIRIPYDEFRIEKPVVIEDFVWIGANVCIVPGVTIEEGAVVGMGSVVVNSIPKCSVVGGNPAEIIGYRSVETFEKLKSEGKYF
jgi:acetyltransferase-like isoleucine patch superfamily enzyme